MYLIVGLGNPEKKYEKTKHNCGFDAIDELIEHFDIPNDGIAMKGVSGKTIIGGQKVMVMKPLTYMNLSGHAIRAYVDYYKIDVENELVVIYDDLDLECGSLRVRKKGRAGSHNGMKSIVEALGTTAFPRIRVGIGPKDPKWDLADYVLSPFSKEKRALVDEALEEIVPIVEMIVEGNIDRAMDRYNKKEVKNPEKE